LPLAERAAQLAPNAGPVIDTLGHARLMQGDLPGAQAALENARRLSPELASVHFHLGQLYRQLGNADASRAAFTEALRLEPGAPWAAEAKAALQNKPAAKR
ncbi:MAG: tetratricopeptide repeat protein, partial [Acidimicrobiales bacterium]|nr:tetratricopeptide repeat protein [Acidimicrobiales bacterium]